MRIFLIAALIAAFTMPAYSQMGGLGGAGGGGKGGGGRSPPTDKPAVDPEKKKAGREGIQRRSEANTWTGQEVRSLGSGARDRQ